MKALEALDRDALAAALAECGADGWLLFDFQGHNPVANRFSVDCGSTPSTTIRANCWS